MLGCAYASEQEAEIQSVGRSAVRAYQLVTKQNEHHGMQVALGL